MISLQDMEEKFRYNKVFIWGASHLSERLLICFQGCLSDVTIWDTSKAGQLFSGYEIQKPDLAGLDTHMLQNCYVILAFTTEKNYKTCTELLLNAGFKNIINGSELIEQIVNDKMKADYDAYKKANTDDCFMINDQQVWLLTEDLYAPAGANFNHDYLNQDLWAAKKVFSKNPPIHYDIGSRVDGFITHLLSFGMHTVLIDIRPLNTYGIENLTFVEDDATLLSGFSENTIESLSALCSLEHFGLGRYGDPIDPDAHKKAFQNIQRVLKKDGDLYISVPISRDCKLIFNAHRIYSPQYILEQFSTMELVEFSYISSNGLIRNMPIDNVTDGYNVTNACAFGLFHFRKR